jgi:hypothetical protein
MGRCQRAFAAGFCERRARNADNGADGNASDGTPATQRHADAARGQGNDTRTRQRHTDVTRGQRRGTRTRYAGNGARTRRRKTSTRGTHISAGRTQTNARPGQTHTITQHGGRSRAGVRGRLACERRGVALSPAQQCTPFVLSSQYVLLGGDIVFYKPKYCLYI